MMLRSDRQNGFTLVELLSTMALLVIITMFSLQLIESARRTTSHGEKRRKSDSQARLILDRMALDFAQMVRRADIDCLYKDPSSVPPQAQPGNDQLLFFAAAPGFYLSPPTAASRKGFCLTGYRMKNLRLERLAKGLSWGPDAGGPMIFLPERIATRWPDVTGAGNDPDYAVIGDQVIRFEYGYQLKSTGKLSNTPFDPAAKPPENQWTGFSQINAIHVVIALMDEESMAIWKPDPAIIQTAFPDFTDEDIAHVWSDKLKHPSFAQETRLPPQALANVRIYSRTFHLSGSR
jgi:prepilin-type N-terminal cleavage/methylation domain-containing protein